VEDIKFLLWHLMWVVTMSGEWVRILTQCAKNPGLVARMGENLHELTEANFDMNKVAIQRLNLYEELMSVKVQD